MLLPRHFLPRLLTGLPCLPHLLPQILHALLAQLEDLAIPVPSRLTARLQMSAAVQAAQNAAYVRQQRHQVQVESHHCMVARSEHRHDTPSMHCVVHLHKCSRSCAPSKWAVPAWCGAPNHIFSRICVPSAWAVKHIASRTCIKQVAGEAS